MIRTLTINIKTDDNADAEELITAVKEATLNLITANAMPVSVEFGEDIDYDRYSLRTD